MAASKRAVISGRVIAGLGEGRYFVGQAKYRKQFIKKLDMNPYLGTLNLKLSATNARKLMRIRRKKGMLIKGFRKGKRNFGDVVCYGAETSDIRCALIVPKLSKHNGIAEIIADRMLRRTLALKNGSVVKISVSI